MAAPLLSYPSGCTFLYGPAPNDLHLFVVLQGASSPGEMAVVVPFTSADPPLDPTLILHVGEHSFIQHDTCVNYRFLDILPYAVLCDRESRNANLLPIFQTFHWHEDVTAELLGRLRQGVILSNRIAKGNKQRARDLMRI